jgi:glycosyltransferase involved in cell wall biosynthesis
MIHLDSESIAGYLNRALQRKSMSEPIRIAFLINNLDYGGAETQLFRLALLLKARGWDVRVYTMLTPKAYATELEAAYIRVQSLGMARGVGDPRGLLRLAGLLREYAPQVFISFMIHSNLLARLTRVLYWMPVQIASARSITEGARWRELAYRITDPLSDMTTQVSQRAAERYIRVGATPAHKMRVIANGVDTARFAPDAAARERLRAELGLGDAFVWAMIGSFEPAKDHDTLLRSFALVLTQRPHTLLLLAGRDEPLRSAMEALARELGVAERVRFLGVRRDVPALMNAADAVVLSSAWEGMPNVLLEASSCAVPVVATDVGGVREVVVTEQTGFIVAPRSPEKLTQAMLRLMALSNDECKVMGELGRAYIFATYSFERVIEQWEALIRELLAKKGIHA